MTKHNLTCIGCPMGCQLEVEILDKENILVTGHTCKRGEIYGKKEVTNPTRIVTTTVRVDGGQKNLVSVKTEQDIPKDKIFECVQELKKVRVQAPISIGDIILVNVADTGVNMVATKKVEEVSGKY